SIGLCYVVNRDTERTPSLETGGLPGSEKRQLRASTSLKPATKSKPHRIACSTMLRTGVTPIPPGSSMRHGYPGLLLACSCWRIAYSAALFWLSWCKHEHHRHRHDCLPFGKKQQHLSVSFERR